MRESKNDRIMRLVARVEQLERQRDYFYGKYLDMLAVHEKMGGIIHDEAAKRDNCCTCCGGRGTIR